MKMKYSIIILTVLIGFALQSCDDFFEVYPNESLVQSEYWKTKEDVEAVLMGSYSELALLDEMHFLNGEIRGDMVEYDGTNANLGLYNDGDIRPDNNLFKWDNYYQVISYANYVIDFADEVDDKTYTDYMRQGHIAEAKFLRAFTYFNLVKIYKEVPLVLRSARSDNQDFYLPKNTEDEILEQVLIDLTAARNAIPEEYGDIENNKGRATPMACEALFTEVYLWLEEYEKSIEHALNVDTSIYAFTPAIQWFEMFSEGNSLESIFELQFDQTEGQSTDLYNYTNSANTWIGHIPTLVAVDKLYPVFSNEKIRGDGSIVYSPTTNSRGIWKYIGEAPDGQSTRSGNSLRSANFIVYRAADVYLMAAEAMNQLGRFNEAMDIVNTIRVRALLTPLANPGNKNEIEDIILEERAKEFAFEGKRWWDLLRMARRNNGERKADFINIVIKKLPVNMQMVVANRLNDPMSWYLPIHNDELENNINLVQNPYYAPYSQDIR